MKKNTISDILMVAAIALTIGGFAAICGLFALKIAGGLTLAEIAVGLIIAVGVLFQISTDLDEEEEFGEDEEDRL